MASTQHYDALVVGAGQAGVPLAGALAAAGRRTALVEREHVGGTCINEGCTPTKTMVASARVAYLARRGADYGVNTGPITIDMNRVRQRKRDIVESFRSGDERHLMTTENLELIYGVARFVDHKTIEIRLNESDAPQSKNQNPKSKIRTLTADAIVINTGTRPSEPRLEGVEKVPTLNSTTIMELDVVPEHLLVLGGG